MAMYDQKEFDVPTIKRAIVRYFLACSNDNDQTGKPSKEALSAKQHLKTLRSRDPKTVQQVERFFRID